MIAWLQADDWLALWLSCELAFVTTALLVLICTPLAWWLARSRSHWLALVDTFFGLPLVLPPTVLGFYLLCLLGSGGPLGNWAFSFSGLVMGSCVFSFPFVLQAIQNQFRQMPQEYWEAAACMGAGPIDRFFTIALPLALPGILTGALLGFAHTLGEFGVVLMIGGSIPDQTRVASIAIYEHVETLAYGQAHRLSATMVGLAICISLPLAWLNRRQAIPA